ncbi:MAG TPA: cob(I)yrinic acid a,c-diamide adenosyltransferase [Thermoanaerobaculia bacterium]|nr:cob(I)yrinic acid a,c-diamide adenosyltransferase [Thermoanaerobaculia bacterium]
MRLSKIYTRTGDAGETSLIGGRRVAKDSARIESFGAIDELQATLGLLRAALGEAEGEPVAALRDEVLAALDRVQNDLFDAGNMLSTPPDSPYPVPRPITGERIAWLEETMDGWLAGQEPLRSFILSGGGRYSALAHLARTVCRRAERAAIGLAREEIVAPEALAYLNRLSDFLFVLARRLAAAFGEAEPLWRTPLETRKGRETGGDEGG